MNLNELRDRAYKNACDKGFYTKKRSDEHYLCLVITELCEAIQADRANKRANIEKFNWFQERSSDPDKMFNSDFEVYIHSTVEDELADAAIRLLSFAGYKNVDLILSDFGIEDCSDWFKEKTFTEAVLKITRWISDNTSTKGTEITSLECLFGLAKSMGIDLFKHIELKMKYNQTREKLHGKRY